jgi:protection-of-telomeres protein 1
MNVSFRANVRVVDFFPPDIRDFAHRLDNENYNDATDPPDGSQMELDDVKTWEWMFYLIVEDCEKGPNGEHAKVPLLVHGQDAEYLLNIEAAE